MTKKFNVSASQATIMLYISAIFGGIMPIASKIILRELPPITTLFFSITVMLIFFFPSFFKRQKIMIKHLHILVVFGLLWTGNVMLFIIGVQYTSAFVSQILYSVVPIYVLLILHFLGMEKITIMRLMGVIFGITGILFFVSGSYQNLPSFGTTLGNLIILTATISWSLYLVRSKQLSISLSPIELTIASAFVGWIVSLICMLVFEGTTGIIQFTHLSSIGWIAFCYIGLFVRVFMILIYNWGIKYGSPFAAACAGYIAPLVTGVVGWTILSEPITIGVMIGAVFLFVGVFFTSIMPLIQKKHLL